MDPPSTALCAFVTVPDPPQIVPGELFAFATTRLFKPPAKQATMPPLKLDPMLTVATVTDVVPDTAPNIALIVVEPLFMPVTSPLVAKASDTVAMEVLSDCQVTSLVMSSVEASL